MPRQRDHVAVVVSITLREEAIGAALLVQPALDHQPGIALETFSRRSDRGCAFEDAVAVNVLGVAILLSSADSRASGGYLGPGGQAARRRAGAARRDDLLIRMRVIFGSLRSPPPAF